MTIDPVIRRVIILGYHGIDVRSSPRRAAAFRRIQSDLDADLTMIRHMGYHLISFYDLLMAIRVKKPLLNDGVILTFDDGLMSVYDQAIPILRRQQAPATFFIPTDKIGDRYHFSEAVLRDIQSDPLFDIESHGAAHRNYKLLSDEEIEEDLGRSVEVLKKFGVVSRILALPYGDMNTPAIRRIAQAHGFWGARLGIGGPIELGLKPCPLWDMPCYLMHENSDLKTLLNRRAAWPSTVPVHT